MPYSAQDFARDTAVSRETLARLEDFATLLRKWQRRINLVSDSSLGDLWRRHMLDSAQILAYAPRRAADRRLNWVDLGSGAGFPGLVVAIMGAGEVHLIESNARKCAFLGEAARITGARVTIHCDRIGDIEPWPADVITARACAPLGRLLALAQPFTGPRSRCLFLKGQDIEFELTEASKCWRIDAKVHKSRSSPSGAVLEIRGSISVRQPQPRSRAKDQRG